MIQNKTHREFGKFYLIWKGMKSRCTNIENPNYGGRGIKVIPEWNDFVNFHSDMYQGYKKALKILKSPSIERINNNLNYTPENCTWIDKSNQPKNRRTNILITYRGSTHTLAEWSRIKDVDYDALRSRIVRHNKPISEAMSKKYRNRYQKVQQLNLEGQLIADWPTIKDAGNALGIESSGIIRAAQGKSSNSGGFLWKYIL